MAAPKESEFNLSFPLDLGVDNAAMDTAVQPVGSSPTLVASVNTRLSKVRGVPVKSPGITAIDVVGDSPCGGIVPAGNVDSSIAFFHPVVGNRRIAGSAAGPILGTVDSTKQNSYYPAQVSRAGTIPGFTAYEVPCVAYDTVNDRTWSASLRYHNSADTAIYVSALTDDARIVIQPIAVEVFSSITPGSVGFVGLTCHGANGTVLWYRDMDDGNKIKVRRLSVTGTTLTVSSATTLYTPVAASIGQVSVSSDSDTHAYLATIHDTVNTVVTLNKIAISNFSVSSSFSESGMCSSTSRIQCTNYVSSQGIGYLALIVGDNASGANIALYDADLNRTWGPHTGLLAPANEVTCGFMEGPGSYAVFAVTDTAGGIATLATAGTQLQFRDLAAGGLINTFTIPWMRPATQMSTLKVTDNEVYPVLAMQRFYDRLADPTEEGYLADPSIEVVRPGNSSGYTVLGRFGVDTAYGLTMAIVLKHSSSSYVTGGKFFFTYLEASHNDAAIYDGWVMRYAEMDFLAGQPRYALTAEGSALIAAALPAQWDGVEITEFSPLHQPKIHVADSGGSGATLTSGTYRFAAVFQWKDANGVMHRSMPSEVRSVTGASMEPVISVAVPVSMRDGVRQELIQTILYASEPGQTVLYAQRYEVTSSTAYFWTFGDIEQPVVDDAHPPIYSDGSADMPLVSQCPPAFRDIAIVGNRAWALDAERPNVVWPSKVHEPFTAFEWSSDLKIEFPASAGALLAVEESGGFPIFPAERGLYTISGPGPDNLLVGEWNPPEQLSDAPCTDGRSVVKTPAGILFRSHDRYVLFSGGPRVVENIAATDLVAAFVLRPTSEALLVGEGSTHYVYNYALDRWTVWDQTTIPVTTCAAQVPTSGLILLHSDETLYKLDPAVASTSAQMSFTTGHVLLGGPEDDNVVRDIVLHAKSLGSHGVTVTIVTDYGAQTFTRVYGAGDVTSCTVNGQYTLSVSPGTMSMRAVKITVTETGAGGDVFRPVSMTITYAKNPGTKRDAVQARGRSPLGT